jgi:hypothetical protein
LKNLLAIGVLAAVIIAAGYWIYPRLFMQPPTRHMMAAGENQYGRFSFDSSSVMKTADGTIDVRMQIDESPDSQKNKQLVANGEPRITATYWMLQFDCENHTAKVLSGLSSNENSEGDSVGLNGLTATVSNAQSPVGKIMGFACMPAWRRWLNGRQDSL